MLVFDLQFVTNSVQIKTERIITHIFILAIQQTRGMTFT